MLFKCSNTVLFIICVYITTFDVGESYNMREKRTPQSQWRNNSFSSHKPDNIAEQFLILNMNLIKNWNSSPPEQKLIELYHAITSRQTNENQHDAQTYTSTYNENQIQKFNSETDHEPFLFNSRGLISPPIPPATLDHQWGPSENTRPPPLSSQPQEDNIYQDEKWQSVRSAPPPLPPYYNSHNLYFQGPSSSLHSSGTYPIHSSSTHSNSLTALAPNSPSPYLLSPSYQWPPPPPPHHHHHLPPPPPPNSYNPPPPPNSYHHPPPLPKSYHHPPPPPPPPPPLYPHNYDHPPSPHHHQPYSPPPPPPPAPFYLHNNERSPDPYHGQFSYDSKFSEQFQQSTNNNRFSQYYSHPSPDSKYQSISAAQKYSSSDLGYQKSLLDSHVKDAQNTKKDKVTMLDSCKIKKRLENIMGLFNYQTKLNETDDLKISKKNNEDISVIDIRSGFNADNKEPRILLNELSTTTKNLRDQELFFIKNLFNNSEPTDTPLTVSFFQVMPVTPKE